jgi:multidrug efflux pump subunit AcrA (membrane-fusion protein)
MSALSDLRAAELAQNDSSSGFFDGFTSSLDDIGSLLERAGGLYSQVVAIQSQADSAKAAATANAQQNAYEQARAQQGYAQSLQNSKLVNYGLMAIGAALVVGIIFKKAK